MTLVLEISWSAAASTITVVDTAAHSTVASGSAGHPPSTDGQQDPEAWWGALVRSSEAAIEELAALDLAAADVAMVLVRPGEPVGGLVAVGPSGDVVHPALLGDHAASGADGDWLLSKVDGGESAWRATTGTTPTAGSTVALLSWLHRARRMPGLRPSGSPFPPGGSSNASAATPPSAPTTPLAPRCSIGLTPTAGAPSSSRSWTLTSTGCRPSPQSAPPLDPWACWRPMPRHSSGCRRRSPSTWANRYPTSDRTSGGALNGRSSFRGGDQEVR